MNTPGTKNAMVRRLVREGEYKRALQICKDWHYDDPTYSNILRSGYDCLQYPGFYKQIGKNPEVEYYKAVEILKRVFVSSLAEKR